LFSYLNAFFLASFGETGSSATSESPASLFNAAQKLVVGRHLQQTHEEQAVSGESSVRAYVQKLLTSSLLRRSSGGNDAVAASRSCIHAFDSHPCITMSGESPPVVFRRRRRRKRPRPSGSVQGSDAERRRVLSEKNGQRDSARKADEGDENLVKREHRLQSSFPVLLHMRATGRLRQGDSVVQHSLGKRSLRFSQLQSSNSEAVLALEQSGSYFVSLAGSTAVFTLALRLYSVPSPFMLQKATSSSVSPLIATIPLSLPSNDDSDDESASSVATTPVQIVVSRDWSVGMALVHHSTSTDRYVQEEDALGDLILFSLSTSGYAVQSYKCPNVRVAGSKAYTMRNLLWETNTIPYGHSTSTALCSQVLRLPGYLFLNDEEDGFRLTWVLCAEWEAAKDTCVEPLPSSCLSTMPSRHDIISKSDEVVWEECWSDRYTGRRMPPSRDCRTLDIAFESYFRVDALLHDILARRRDKFGYQENALPEFHYNLISIGHDGRTATLVIVFGRTAQSGAATRRLSVGVFLRIDILTQAYEESGWVQNLATPTEAVLRKWCNVLAVIRRMRDQRVGPFCSDVGQGKALGTLDWTMFYNDTNSDYDQSQDDDVQVWGKYLSGLKSLKQGTSSVDRLASPKCVSCLRLFPNCDLVTNDAVRLARPVPFIQCRNLTTEFIYG